MSVPAAFSFLRNAAWFNSGMCAVGLMVSIQTGRIWFAGLFLLIIVGNTTLANRANRQISRGSR